MDWADDNSRGVYEHDNPDARDIELVAITLYHRTWILSGIGILLLQGVVNSFGTGNAGKQAFDLPL
ncbi:MAG: hypothetical protein J5979_01145 [Lachnospiraceae bacterium]|nr:hypothetical protein [Lachnospiraceae bacterium]